MTHEKDEAVDAGESSTEVGASDSMALVICGYALFAMAFGVTAFTLIKNPILTDIELFLGYGWRWALVLVLCATGFLSITYRKTASSTKCSHSSVYVVSVETATLAPKNGVCSKCGSRMIRVWKSI